MYNKISKYLFLTCVITLFFITIHTCSNKVLSHKILYQSDVVVTHLNNQKDTIRNVIFFDHLEVDQDFNLIKKDGTIVTTNVKKFKYLNSIQKTL